jgi:hypothetical protein
MSAGPSRGDLPEDDPGAMRLVIDLDLGLLPDDPGAELRRTLGFWTAWLPKMDLRRPAEHELHDSNYQVVGTLRLIDANATEGPEATR